MSTIKINVLGEERQVEKGITISAIAKEYQDRYEDDIVLAKVNGELRELFKYINRDSEISFVTTKDKIGRKTYRRSVILLVQRALDIFEEGLSAKLKVNYSMGQGYYCDVVGRSCDAEFLCKIKEIMQELVEKDIPMKKTSVRTRDAIETFRKAGYTDKEKLLKYRRSSATNIYDLEGTKDYFYGYMCASTGALKYFDLMPYDEGFMLLFPDKNTKEVAPFEDRPKLFKTLKASSEWGKTMKIDTVGALNDAICAGKTRDVILTQEALMEDRIGDIAKEIVSRGGIKFVLIAGPSSSGKTSFSHRLSNQLRARGITPHPVPLDMFYKDHEFTPRDENGNFDFECLEALDVELFNKNMIALLNGETVEMPNYNFKTGKREYKGDMLKISDGDILVIEGIHGLNEKMTYALPAESKFKIYISALTQLSIDEHNPLPTTDGRLIRRMVRDARTRGSSVQETIAMWESVRRGEENYIFPFQEEADVMFNSALIYELAVLKIYAEPQLFAIAKDAPEYPEAKRLLKLLEYFLPIPPEDIVNNSLAREFIGGSIFPV